MDIVSYGLSTRLFFPFYVLSFRGISPEGNGEFGVHHLKNASVISFAHSHYVDASFQLSSIRITPDRAR